MSFMRKVTSLLTASAFALAFGLSPLGYADAASYSKPSSSSSFSRSAPSFRDTAPSRPSFGYSKPDSAPSVAPKSAPTFGYSKPSVDKPVTSAPAFGYSKPGGSAAPVATAPRIIAPSALAASSSKVMSGDSLAKYKAERATAKAPPQAVDVTAARMDPTFTSATRRYANVNSYMADRDRTVSIYRQAHPNVYLISGNMHPNYGAYDNSFLVGMMLGSLGSETANANWMYMHQNDPWYGQWHADMLAQSQNNTELQTKMEAMEAQMATMKTNNVVINPAEAALPEGVSPALAIAPEAMIANASVMQEDSGHGFFFYFFIMFTLVVVGSLVYLFIVGRRE